MAAGPSAPGSAPGARPSPARPGLPSAPGRGRRQGPSTRKVGRSSPAQRVRLRRPAVEMLVFSGNKSSVYYHALVMFASCE